MLREERLQASRGFYSLRNTDLLVRRRKEGVAKAKPLLRKAAGIARLLSALPFVRGVAVSGSLSKYFADEGSDIDYFIITARDRLWVARTCTHVLKKLSFLLGMQDYFCMNYYVDETSMEIPEKNVFTATEIVTLLPVTGPDAFRRFRRDNDWTEGYLPNHPGLAVAARAPSGNLLRRAVEWCLSGRAGRTLDDVLMRVTVRRWAAKARRGKRNARGGLMAMSAGKHFSKPAPGDFQAEVVRYRLLKTAEVCGSIPIEK